MTPKKMCAAVVFTTVIFCSLYARVLAENVKPAAPVITSSSMQSADVAGVVGKIDYAEFKSKGESMLVIKDKKGEAVKISLQEIKNEATVLATYRKEKDKKG
ncbi:MAG: hypothetical protein PHO30_05705, partial [Candidatus Omnitrophica bacterium]|nr:hypothetical protein [Candidatus Omnitrophota bacterium]